MFNLTAIGDEISPDLITQLNLLKSENIGCIELRSVGNKNILDWTDEELSQVRKTILENNFTVCAICSPIGKIKITDSFAPHLERFKKALYLAKYFQTNLIRIFGYYIPEGQHADYRDEVIQRLRTQTLLAEKENIILLLENEDASLYGSVAEEIQDILETINSVHLRFLFDPGNYTYFFQKNPYTDLFIPLRKYIQHIHIKDICKGSDKFNLPGIGDSQYPAILEDLKKYQYSGYLSLEPHLASGGTGGGFAGIEGTQQAIVALKILIQKLNSER